MRGHRLDYFDDMCDYAAITKSHLECLNRAKLECICGLKFCKRHGKIHIRNEESK
ncbi:MAG: hypothetical protein UT24_C0003G0070 [Candidatus Woesebacteria bacterium GW2011_GWB1_39_12]|uniref:Uncharacterized protein n=1 Tax=Candidatus Woesebacteria bacterium GW2011_GWB1_39_12 TaxID=1618574 RepID=A0A0G0MEQ7_9BACT|nr:MAG: hypothetical protein UT24_C0003G0070 [Candidatus Woesebacteria bacterium GW2011_GWB1_39_12]